MNWRRPASSGFFAVGILLLVIAGVLLAKVSSQPSQGFGDLAYVVGAMILAGVAGIPFALSLILARATRMPRWMVAAAAAGCVLAMAMSVLMFIAGSSNSTLFGAVFLAAGLAGLASVPPAWRAPLRHA